MKSKSRIHSDLCSWLAFALIAMLAGLGGRRRRAASVKGVVKFEGTAPKPYAHRHVAGSNLR